MTDEENITNVANKNNEQETIESDIEQDESVGTDDKSNVTTDDEFYNELMSAPPEFEDHLIPDGCKDEILGIEHLTSCLNRRYNSCPVVFTGTLKDAIKEAFNSKEIKERRPLLIYINNDKSLYSNLFCEQLLCHEKIIEFLLNNYVLWTWDVTFQSNGEKLNELYQAAFAQWNTLVGTKSVDQYPLLIGILHDINGDYVFNNLINGSDRRAVIDEFLARLIQFKDQFDFSELSLERELNKYSSDTLLKTHNLNHRFNNQDFFQLTSMNYGRNSSRYSPFSRNESSLNDRRLFLNTFQQLNINPSDDSDDEDEEPTPTIDRPIPKFPE